MRNVFQFSIILNTTGLFYETNSCIPTLSIIICDAEKPLCTDILEIFVRDFLP